MEEGKREGFGAYGFLDVWSSSGICEGRDQIEDGNMKSISQPVAAPDWDSAVATSRQESPSLVEAGKEC